LDVNPLDVIEGYRTKGILLDTNLFVLLAVGICRPTRISSFKRTSQYTPEDFSFVARLVDRFTRRITTPHILAEADNLTRQLPQADHRALAATMTFLTTDLLEVYVPSAEAVRDLRYADLGLTDCVTVAATNETLVITDDFRLSNILAGLGRDAININHIRPLYWT
jgi:hypothetical protein